MLTFAIIGLVCNSLGCYWVRDDDRTTFTDQQVCASTALKRTEHSVMYFNAACIVVPRQTEK
jgi:hypothetical protein